MLVIQVSGIDYTLPHEFMHGSTVISNMLLCANNHASNNNIIKIPININSQVWLDYLELINDLMYNHKHDISVNDTKYFVEGVCITYNIDHVNDIIPLVDMTKIVNCLYVIDLLEHKSHLTLLHGYVYNHYNCDLVHINQLLKMSSFVLSDIDPFFATKNISQMITLLKGTGSIKRDYIDHIYNVLYKPHMSKQSSDTCFFYVKRDSLRTINSKLVIKYPTIDRFIYLSRQQRCHIYNTKSPVKISPRVAAYYANNSNHSIYQVYDEDHQTLVVCPRSYCRLVKVVNNTNINQYHYVCVHDSLDMSLNNYMFNNSYPTIKFNDINHDIQQCNDYIPLSYYNTGLTLGNYVIQTYNLLSLDQHDYHKLLIYEVDPYAKVLYAFCL